MDSQSRMILEHLKSGHSITPLEALNKFGCFRLGARIWDLKSLGYQIQTEIVSLGRKRWASYSLKVEDEKANEEKFNEEAGQFVFRNC